MGLHPKKIINEVTINIDLNISKKYFFHNIVLTREKSKFILF